MGDFSRDQMVAIGYHMNWPGTTDPYYVANPTQNMARRIFYGITGIPAYRIDGTYNSLPSSGSFESLITSRVGTETPYSISVDANIVGDQVVADVTVIVEDSIGVDTRLYTVLTKTHDILDPPAPNGVEEYYNPMVQMEPAASGEVLTSSGGNDTLNFSYSFDFNTDWSVANLTVVSFIQEHASHQVKQAAAAQVPGNIPNLSYVSHQVLDDDAADPNGRPDPGETVGLEVTLLNQPNFLHTTNLTGTLSCDDPNVDITTATSTWPLIQADSTGNNLDDPFEIHVPDDYVARYVIFTVNLEDSTGYSTNFSFEQLVGRPNVVFVNDFGNGQDESSYWHDMFLNAGFAPQVMSGEEAVTADVSSYQTLIWSTSNGTGDVIDENEQAQIQDFMDNGGHVLLTGEKIGEDIGGTDWFRQYFGCEHALDVAPGQSRVRLLGVEDGPFADADLALLGAQSPNNCFDPSTITALDGSTPLYHYIMTDDLGGVGYITDTHASIYLGFNLEAVSGAEDTETAAVALQQMVDWMNGISGVKDGQNPETVLPTSITLGAYPNPFNAMVTVNFSLPARQLVKVDVVNMLGRRVARLVNQPLTAGQHEVSWDASQLSSGVYIVRLSTQNQQRMQKVQLIK